METKETKSSGAYLPLDILVHGVWPLLTQRDVFCRAQFVCKLWRQNIFKSIKVLDFTLADTVGRFKLSVNDLATDVPSQHWFATVKVINKIPPGSIEKLVINCSRPILPTMSMAPFDHGLEALCTRFTSLRDLDLRITYDVNGIIDVDHPLFKLKNLQAVRFEGSTKVFTHAAWATLAPHDIKTVVPPCRMPVLAFTCIQRRDRNLLSSSCAILVIFAFEIVE
eukprot:TRINITY_DN740_c0_g1_i3.p2 TRINITY_DN740_c0_g1~~TRINITY_DN740_c0_g1_i3.p2  ORF type:complete len:223 (-),score=21.62 TRINITY_DN740_c0_g1_i3:1106-1774(-)